MSHPRGWVVVGEELRKWGSFRKESRAVDEVRMIGEVNGKRGGQQSLEGGCCEEERGLPPRMRGMGVTTHCCSSCWEVMRMGGCWDLKSWQRLN